MSIDSKLMIKKISLDRDKIENYDDYPFNIELVKNFNELEFKSSVTFLLVRMV